MHTLENEYVLFQFDDTTNEHDILKKQWRSFCDFHVGKYKQALDEYQNQASIDNVHVDKNEVWVNVTVCMFYLGRLSQSIKYISIAKFKIIWKNLNLSNLLIHAGMYTEAQELIESIPNSPIKVRLLFHLAHKLSDENRLLELSGSLRDVTEDQLSLASMHYLRAHYQDAIDIYKRVLLDNKDYIALNIYLGLCYYKLDYYDISQEVFDIYSAKFPDSIIAINLKACNRFKLANGRAAEMELRNLINADDIFGADLIKHNMVVFRNGEGALHVLPELVDIIPEARLNLAIHYLRSYDVDKAQDLLKSVQPSIPCEYILKGVVHTLLGFKLESVQSRAVSI